MTTPPPTLPAADVAIAASISADPVSDATPYGLDGDGAETNFPLAMTATAGIANYVGQAVAWIDGLDLPGVAADAETASTAAAQAQAAVGGVRVTNADTTAHQLSVKLLPGAGLAAAVGSPGGDETMTIGLTGLAGSIAALTMVADRIIYGTGAGTVALTTLTAYARSLLDDGDAATARATLGAGTVTSVTVAAGGGMTGGGTVTTAGTVTLSIAASSNGYGTRSISTSTPSGGADGDVWLKV